MTTTLRHALRHVCYYNIRQSHRVTVLSWSSRSYCATSRHIPRILALCSSEHLPRCSLVYDQYCRCLQSIGQMHSDLILPIAKQLLAIHPIVVSRAQRVTDAYCDFGYLLVAINICRCRYRQTSGGTKRSGEADAHQIDTSAAYVAALRLLEKVRSVCELCFLERIPCRLQLFNTGAR